MGRKQFGKPSVLAKLKSMGCADEVTGVLDREPKKWERGCLRLRKLRAGLPAQEAQAHHH